MAASPLTKSYPALPFNDCCRRRLHKASGPRLQRRRIAESEILAMSDLPENVRERLVASCQEQDLLGEAA